MKQFEKEITILAIDDDPLVLRLVEASLVRENYKLVFAPNGEIGIKLAEEVHPDLILLDIVMPGMDGFEVCQYIRSRPELKNIPIIILTALDDRDSKVQGLEAGADDYICKPFDKIEFRARIKTITRLTQNYINELTNLKIQLEEKNNYILELKKMHNIV